MGCLKIQGQNFIVLLFHRHNFFSLLLLLLHSSFYTFLKQGVPMCFWRCQKNTSFFWREIQFRHLASDNTLSSKKNPKKCDFFFYYEKCTSFYFGKTYLIIHHQILSDFYLVLRMKSHIEGILITYT